MQHIWEGVKFREKHTFQKHSFPIQRKHTFVHTSAYLLAYSNMQ